MESYKNADQVMGLIRSELHGWDLKVLANRIGMSTSALYSIRRGKAKWPRDSTFFSLIHTFGFELHLGRKETRP